MKEKDRIRDIPSFKKADQEIQNFKALKRAMPILEPLLGQLGINADQIDKALPTTELLEKGEDLLSIPDRFNYVFADRGWIMYESMNLEVVRSAIKKAEEGDFDGAEAELINYYDEDTIRWKLKEMKRLEVFRARWPLAMKALIDYKDERYHACVPVILALLDGMVNEAHEKGLGQKLGFFAEDANLEAWDSISAHSKGLKALACIFQKGRKKTTTDSISIPYRNGIMHGMDLGYDNKMVAAKAWAALFAARDWAEKAEQGLLDPQPPERTITWEELAQRLQENEIEKARLDKWRPRDIKLGQDAPRTGGPEDYELGTPEQKLAEFLSNWKKPKPNYRAMADCVSLNS